MASAVQWSTAMGHASASLPIGLTACAIAAATPRARLGKAQLCESTPHLDFGPNNTILTNYAKYVRPRATHRRCGGVATLVTGRGTRPTCSSRADHGSS